MASNKHHITPDIHTYLMNHTVRHNDLLETGRNITENEIGIEMQSPQEQLQFYSWLTATFKPNKVLEIGTFSGLATIAIAEHLSDDATITTIDHNATFLKTAQKIWRMSAHSRKIHSIHQKADQALNSLINDNEKFDIILIDANKNQTLEYYEQAHKLSKSGTIIIIDNILFSGKVPKPDAIDTSTSRGRNHAKYANNIHQTNEMIKNDARVFITSIAIGDGITLATIN